MTSFASYCLHPIKCLLRKFVFERIALCSWSAHAVAVTFFPGTSWRSVSECWAHWKWSSSESFGGPWAAPSPCTYPLRSSRPLRWVPLRTFFRRSSSGSLGTSFLSRTISEPNRAAWAPSSSHLSSLYTSCKWIQTVLWFPPFPPDAATTTFSRLWPSTACFDCTAPTWHQSATWLRPISMHTSYVSPASDQPPLTIILSIVYQFCQTWTSCLNNQGPNHSKDFQKLKSGFGEPRFWSRTFEGLTVNSLCIFVTCLKFLIFRMKSCLRSYSAKWYLALFEVILF